jgi:hypothetical protein
MMAMNLKIALLLTGATAMMLTAGMSPASAQTGFPLGADGSGMDKVLRVIGNVNLSQVDAKASQNMQDALEAKSQMYQQKSGLTGRPPAHMAHHTALRGRGPLPMRLPRSF